MYDISFCVKRKDLSDEEYGTIWKYMNKMYRKDRKDEDFLEDMRMTMTYVFGTIDRDDSLYKYLLLQDIDGLEWNE
jgi:hypothetical protein